MSDEKQRIVKILINTVCKIFLVFKKVITFVPDLW
jgi:hypothetical protein